MLRTSSTPPSAVPVFCTCCGEVITSVHHGENLSEPYAHGAFKLFSGLCTWCKERERCPDPGDTE
jgi:hypothetical protein